jgi:hypothetical protein
VNPLHPLERILTRRSGFNRSAAVSATLLGLAVSLTSCTSPTYEAAPKDTLPPVLINLPSTDPPIEALLHTVIKFHGPGSWKRNAYWDEYVVTVANRGNALVTIESATLFDRENTSTVAGENPWELEQASYKLADEHVGFVKQSTIQTSRAVVGGALAGGILVPAEYITGTIYANINSRNAVEQEFKRRRLVLPAVLVPGQLTYGSLFFRISPDAQRLTLHCRVDDTPRDVVIDLTPIADLHLKSPSPGTSPVKQQSADPKR